MTTAQIAPWRIFAVRVRALHPLSPSFLRVTFTGDDLDRFADNGFDQRIKLVFPAACGYPALPAGPRLVRLLARRCRRRAAADPDLHRPRGPPRPPRGGRRRGAARRRRPRLALGDHRRAGRAAAAARAERRATRRSRRRGVRPPAPGSPVLLAGDETAVPAICAILARLPADAYGEALLEVPYDDDALAAARP